MEIAPYRILSRYYDSAWNTFCRNYIDILGIGFRKGGGGWPASCLDLGCGTGELLFQIGQRIPKAHLVGVDLSPDMVSRAARRVRNGDIRCGDMRTISLDRKFDLVTCTHDAMNYLLEPEDLVTLMTNVTGHLAPNGLFAFDFATPAFFQEANGETMETETPWGTVVQMIRYDRQTDRAVTRFIFPEGSTERHDQRAIQEETLAELLRTFGFEEPEEFEVSADDVPTGTVIWTARWTGTVDRSML